MDIVFKLGETKFQNLNFQQQLVVKERGRPLPVLDIEVTGKSRGKTYKRQFNKDIYLRYDWICGCGEKNAFFCFPCALFGTDYEENIWRKKGVRDLIHLSEKVKKHATSRAHISNLMKFSLFGKVNIQAQLDSADGMNIQDHEEVTNNSPSANMVVCNDPFPSDSYLESPCKSDALEDDADPLEQKMQSIKVENTVVKTELSAEEMQIESPIEQVSLMQYQSQNGPIKVKEEIEDVDIVEDQVEPLLIKVEKDMDENDDTFEFVALDSTISEEPMHHLNGSSTEKFEQVTVKEEVDFTSCYCEMCNIKFDQTDQFERHCILHNKSSTYFCSVCLEVYKSKKGITNHFSKHRKIQSLCKCNLCNYTFGSKEDLDMHTKTFKHIKQFSCDECGKEFFLKNNLTVHQRLHTNAIFTCNICGQKFARRLFLQNHIKKHENNKSSKPRVYKCLKCDFTAGDQTEVTEHNKSHTVTFKCELCSYTTYRKYRLTEHKATHFDVKPHECYICKVRFSTRNGLTRHIKSHTEGPFECALCRKAFNLRKYLKDHMKRHVNKDLFECEMCDFKCYQKYDLDKHKIEQNHKKTDKCEICNKEFVSNRFYKLHLSMHAGAEKIGCIFCEEKFIYSGQLLQHIKLTHPDAEPLKCDVCEYTTFVTAIFEKHKQRHKGNRPYVCNICKFGFNYQQSLKRHMKLHLGLTPYECKLCDKKYRTKNSWKLHMLYHSRSSASAKSA